MEQESFAYPSCRELSQLSDEALAVKIARHSPCSLCDCTGLKPPLGVKVNLKDEEEEPSTTVLPFLDICTCTHGITEHGNPPDLDHREQIRRGKVAIRLDELLTVTYSSIHHSQSQNLPT
jgi:histone acetyltransferase